MADKDVNQIIDNLIARAKRDLDELDENDTHARHAFEHIIQRLTKWKEQKPH